MNSGQEGAGPCAQNRRSRHSTRGVGTPEILQRAIDQLLTHTQRAPRKEVADSVGTISACMIVVTACRDERLRGPGAGITAVTKPTTKKRIFDDRKKIAEPVRHKKAQGKKQEKKNFGTGTKKKKIKEYLHVSRDSVETNRPPAQRLSFRPGWPRQLGS